MNKIKTHSLARLFSDTETKKLSSIFRFSIKKTISENVIKFGVLNRVLGSATAQEK